MKATDILGIFIKYPAQGMVKTRIAAAIGNEQATLFYRQLAGSVLKKTMPAADEYKRIVFFEPAERKRDFENWLGNEDLIVQHGADLGEKMSNALAELLKRGGKAVIIGSDIPDIDSSLIADAFQRLDNDDIVLGPAKDGGYYLIGMKVLHESVFEDIRWSTANVLSQTVGNILQAKLTYSLLPELSDVDTIEDYERVKITHPSNL